ncbi:proteasome assembly chaperone 1 isoform X2 [Belonocnema kinseyi]|uniref:proteasome assembly chaperone 1 isoform X2 n=1 Tax=Belonocnema kinseyi TaxID=2817044 RepID=UPI00143CD44A|nr:proteasome assembly chaperone 1 isoform X2 [Belonocnema kinseyi]
MNPHFGEIVQPSSRAFWLDEDDEELQEGSQEDSKFSIEWLQKEPASFEKLIIVEGNMVVDFTKECILPDAKEICIIKHESHKKSSIIYEVDSSLYICIVSTELDLTEAGGFIDIIHGILSKSKKIIALTNCHVSQLKSNEDCSAPSFLKSLSTKDARNSWKVNAPHLGQPNIISGVAAGALSFAEIKGSYEFSSVRSVYFNKVLSAHRSHRHSNVHAALPPLPPMRRLSATRKRSMSILHGAEATLRTQLQTTLVRSLIIK